tara:strand:- start:267 stop:542 length:276 start_codon:yes stop_codon:yes gene_type:complete
MKRKEKKEKGQGEEEDGEEGENMRRCLGWKKKKKRKNKKIEETERTFYTCRIGSRGLNIFRTSASASSLFFFSCASNRSGASNSALYLSRL